MLIGWILVYLIFVFLWPEFDHYKMSSVLGPWLNLLGATLVTLWGLKIKNVRLWHGLWILIPPIGYLVILSLHSSAANPRAILAQFEDFIIRDWFRKHKNWTLVLLGCLASYIIVIAGMLILFTYKYIDLRVVGIYLPDNLYFAGAVSVAQGFIFYSLLFLWYLKSKERSMFYASWLILPVLGLIVDLLHIFKIPVFLASWLFAIVPLLLMDVKATEELGKSSSEQNHEKDDS